VVRLPAWTRFCSELHPVSFSVENGVSFSRCNTIRGEVNHSPQTTAEDKLLRCMELHLHLPICLHDVALNLAQGQFYS
jgi:dTDP-4-dehydrorhamnose 3,5-epimerase-like enzyme